MSLYDSLLIANDFLIPPSPSPSPPELFNGATSCARLRKLLAGLGTSSPRSLFADIRRREEISLEYETRVTCCAGLLTRTINKRYRDNRSRAKIQSTFKGGGGGREMNILRRGYFVDGDCYGLLMVYRTRGNLFSEISNSPFARKRFRGRVISLNMYQV